jgi:hypothetical protein
MWGLLSHVLVLVLEWVRNVHLVQRSIPARVSVTTITLRVRKCVVFPVHIESGGAVLTVVIQSPVTSKLIARHMMMIIVIIITILLAGF